jgi:membrane-bound ClpP family serine protease
MIDDALFYSIKRRTDIALRSGAQYLIYEIQTYGGMVDAADSIAKYLIQKAAKRGHTVAYVTTEAISAGALVSVSCQDIIMQENTTIGDAAPITMGGVEVERERRVSSGRVPAGRRGGVPVLLGRGDVRSRPSVRTRPANTNSSRAKLPRTRTVRCRGDGD